MKDLILKINNFIKKNNQWVGFFVLTLAILYAFFTVLFEPKHIILDILYVIFFGFLIFGIYHSFKTEKEKVKTISFYDIDILFVTIGVFATYSLIHNFSISSVLASSLVGIIGFLYFPKRQVALYCGSFAGMVSSLLFNYYEVIVLSLVCSFIYVLTKPLYKGYGGKLGTIAFLSSLITFSIFNEEFLVVDLSFNFWWLMLISIVGVIATFYIHHKLNTSAVFASAISSAVFTIFIIFVLPKYIEYSVVFFSASFIGMSSTKRLPNIYSALIAGIILGLIYFTLLEYFHGLGGKLGLMAMMSVIITTGISKFFKIKDGEQT